MIKGSHFTWELFEWLRTCDALVYSVGNKAADRELLKRKCYNLRYSLNFMAVQTLLSIINTMLAC